jgi:hypothetical protein
MDIAEKDNPVVAQRVLNEPKGIRRRRFGQERRKDGQE